MAPSSDSLSKAERDLADALDRLKRGKPNHPELVQRLKAGKLEINISTVAIEAGRSRTLISHKNCQFPKLRDAILKLSKPRAEKPPSYKESRDLRRELAVLEEKLALSREENVALIRRAERIENEARRNVEAMKRKLERAEQKSNKKRTDNVIQLVSSNSSDRAD